MPAPKEKPASRPANLVNLMDALKRSIEDQAGKRSKAVPKKEEAPARPERRAKG